MDTVVGATNYDSNLSGNQKTIRGGIEMIKKALRYALIISEEPTEIKKHVEYYMATLGYDRRFRFKWKAISGNYKETLSGIFEYAGERYYFNKYLDELQLERI